jgi:hypothetical protein
MSDTDPILAFLEALGVDTGSVDRVVIEGVLDAIRKLASKPKTPLHPTSKTGTGRSTPSPDVTCTVDGKAVTVEVLHAEDCDCSECTKGRSK